ncbi:tyrosine-type recombinase/integrase [Aureimonas altamirensis]|uniref:tyrosine-type recombinase/integrase n=1 Tax=Aureimonas altamirensis TaxID=370622 RepID=UPI00255678B8|nr:tyrosine-type recombinase/integrase [Aureimonas altamirensis]
MPRAKFPYVQAERNRHGKKVYYFRRGDGPRTRLRGDYGSPEFMDGYNAALTGQPIQPAKNDTLHSVQWLVHEYRKSSNWLELSVGTRRLRDNIFRQILEKVGGNPVSDLNKATVIAGRDKRAGTAPHQARHFMDALRGLFRWALAADKVKVDPTEGVANPKRSRSKVGIEAWTEEDVTTYEKRWPAGTKEFVWLNVLLFTGARRGDAVRFGSSMVKDGVLSFKTEKSQFTVDVHIPVLPPLTAAVEAGGAGKETWIAGATGKKLTKESFGNVFKDAAQAAGVEKSAHGLRKIAATRAAKAGANAQTLDAIFGWTDGQQAGHYTRNADRRKLAIEHAEKLLGKTA